MFYTIYRTTNNVDGKVYIGKHQTLDLDDEYLGSGKLLKRALQKHGRENFSKEILHVFDNEEEMNAKEAELITEEFCSLDTNYNLCRGGKGGWGFVNKNGSFAGRKQSENQKKIAKGLMYDLLNHPKNKEWSSLGGKTQKSMLGKKHTIEARQKMSFAAKNRKSNSQTGTMWITNGAINKKIKAIDNIPEGWYKGRVVC